MSMVQFDYDSIRSDMIFSLENKLNGKLLENSTSVKLIEVVAERLSEISAYAEYLTRESKYSLAQNTSSILNQLELFGYEPHRKVGASGKIKVSAASNFSDKWQYSIVIPKFTRFSNGSLVYCAVEDTVLRNTDNYVMVPIIQGEYYTTGKFSGDSFDNDTYTILDDSIENSLYELVNNGTLCTQVDVFSESRISVNGKASASYVFNNFEYKVKNKSDFSGIELQFESGSHDSNDTFEFRYIVTEGVLGSCLEKNTITKVLDSVVDSNGATVELFCTNEDPIVGGSDVESLEEMRENAPYTFNRVEKIITKNDYIQAFKKVLQNAVFKIWTEADNYDGFWEDTDYINNCKVFMAGIIPDIPSRSISPIEVDSYTSLLDTIANEKPVTDYFVLKTPYIYKFYFKGDLYYDGSKVDLSSIKSITASSLEELYDVKKVEFFKNLYHSSYIKDIQNISGIDHVDLDIILYTEVGYKSGITSKIEDFNSSAEDGKFIFTSTDQTTKELVEDLFYLKKDDSTWKFYNPEGTELSTISWNDISSTEYIDTHRVLDQIKIEDTAVLNALTGKGLVVRFQPAKNNCVFTFESQVLTITDAMPANSGSLGLLSPWKDDSNFSKGITLKNVEDDE